MKRQFTEHNQNMANIKSALESEKRVHCGVTAPSQHLSGLDVFHSCAYFPLVLVYEKGLDLALLEKALIETLKHYPIIAGRLKKDDKGFVYADANDAGIDWRVHRWQGALPWGEGKPLGKDISRLYRMVYPWRVIDRDMPLLQVNVHQFDDNKAILCCYGPHALLDASSYWAFMLEWAKACYGIPVYTPSFDRQPVRDAGQGVDLPADTHDLVVAPSLFGLVKIFAKLGWRAARGMSSELFRVPAATLEKWKADGRAEGGGKDPSGASLVSAYVMRAISPELPPHVDRSVGLVRDLRFMQGVGIARDYFGNAVCYGEVRYSPQELASENLRSLAQRCRPEPEQVGPAAVLKMLRVMEQFRLKKANWRLLFKPTLETLNAGIIVNNCVAFPIYDIDMGTGSPAWYEMPPATIRLLLLVQTPKKDGSIDLMMCGPRKELDALRKRFEADGVDARIKAPAAA